MAEITVNPIVPEGAAVTTTPASNGGDTVKPGQTTFVYIENTSGASRTVTIDSVRKCNQGFDHNAGNSIAPGGIAMFGPLTSNRFSQSTGLVDISYDDETGLEIAAFRI